MNLHCQGLRTGQEGQLKTAERDLHDLAERKPKWTLHSDIVPLYDNAACGLRSMCLVYQRMVARIILVPGQGVRVCDCGPKIHLGYSLLLASKRPS